MSDSLVVLLDSIPPYFVILPKSLWHSSHLKDLGCDDYIFIGTLSSDFSSSSQSDLPELTVPVLRTKENIHYFRIIHSIPPLLF